MNNFKSKDGITIAEVRAELKKQNAVIERDKAYTCRRWIVTVDKNTSFHIRYIPTMGEMLNELKTKKVMAFCKEHEANSDGKTTKVRKEKKLRTKEVRMLKKQKKVNNPRIQELQEQHINLVLERMRLTNTKERKAELAIQLKALRAEIIELGGDPTIGNSNEKTSVSREDMEEARKRGIAKRAEKKDKKTAGKNASPRLKKTASKKAKDEDYEDEIEEDEFDLEEEEEEMKPAKKAKTKAVKKGKK